MNIKVFFDFVVNPKYERSGTLGIMQSIFIVSRSVFWYFLFAIGSFAYIILLMHLNLWPSRPEIINERSIVDVVLLAPFIEELIFRLSLRNFYRNIFISIGVLFWVFSKKYLGLHISTGITVILFSLPFLLKRVWDKEALINQFVKNHFPYFFYLSVVTFGFIHLDNLDELELKHYLISPFLIFFQLVMGLILGNLRVNLKFGIIYSFLAHALINLPIALLNYL